jgi:type II secretory pathway component GspD/PulD (secretin)
MYPLIKAPCNLLLALVLVLMLTLTAASQGQSPTSPRPRPTDQQNPDQYANDDGVTSNANEGRGVDRPSRFDDREDNNTGSGARLSDRVRRSDSQGNERGADAEGAAGAAVTGPAVEGDAVESAGRREAGAPGPRGAEGGGVRTIGGAESGAGGGGGASRGIRGGAAGVTVVGEGTYEPAFDQPLEYGVLPAVGDPLTLEGPMPLMEFLQAIHIATSWNVLLTETAKGLSLDFIIIDTPPVQAMEILKFNDIFFRYDEPTNYLYVMTKEEYLDDTFAEVITHEFVVEHADVTYIESVLTSLLSAKGRLITDQRTNRIYVWDTFLNIEQMIKTVADLDVPLVKRAFEVQHADLADIESVVGTLLSPNGSLIVDARTNQLFVWDTPTVLEQMADAVAELDVPVESKTFHIRWVNSEDVVDSIEALLSERGTIQVDPRFNTLVVTDLPRRIALIEELIGTIDQELDTRTWVVEYADIDFVADQIEMLIPPEMGEIIVQEEVHQITASGLPERLDRVDELIATWDIKRQQVMIEAFLVDMDESVARQFNVQWSYFANNDGTGPVVVNSPTSTGRFPGIGGQDVTVGTLPYAIPLYGPLSLVDGEITRPLLRNTAGNTIVDRFEGNRLAVSLDYLDQNSDTVVLAAPRVTVQDGEEAIFENARRVPFASSTTTFSNINYGNSTSRVEFVDVGIILRVRPRITEAKNVLLDVAAEDSSAELIDIETFSTGGEDDNVSTRKAPEVRTRNVETQLRIQSGDTAVLGGLREDRSSQAYDRTPILGDIPILGKLFNNPRKDSAARSLMIFITPTVVDEYTHPEAHQLANVDTKIAERHRYNMKSLWERIRSRISQGENEISVSIGQTGEIFSEGAQASTDELRDAFFQVEMPGTVTVVVREHPRAPEAVVTAVVEAAMEAGLKVDFDESSVPLIPRMRETEPSPAAPVAVVTPVTTDAAPTVVPLVAITPKE